MYDAKNLCPDIEFNQLGSLGLITLKREKALNAINYSMVLALRNILEQWRDNDSIKYVLIEGEGRAFSAGGDIVSVYHNQKKGEDPFPLFDKKYDLNVYIKNYPKPYLTFLDGIVMGGGAGISMHGAYRIGTKNTLFAMPEVAIGFFPDVGAHSFLAHLPKSVIRYICLSAARLNWGESLKCKLLTHAIRLEDYNFLKAALTQGTHPDHVLPELNIISNTEPSKKIITHIDQVFGHNSLEECLEALEKAIRDDNGWAVSVFDRMKKASPTSLKLTFYYMDNYKEEDKDLQKIADIEKTITKNMLMRHDFIEGIRALLIDKDNKPNWKIKDVNDIKQSYIESFFS